MKNIKQQFQDFRSDTPKHIQWLLLAVAFIVVIILLFLLLSGKSNKDSELIQRTPHVLVEPASISFEHVKVGSKKEDSVIISTNIPVNIEDIKITKDEEEFTVIPVCGDVLESSCTINLIYKPTEARQDTKTSLEITWQAVDEDISHPETVEVFYSSYEEKKVEVKPVEEPPVIPEEPVIPEPVMPEPVIPEPEQPDPIFTPNPFPETPVATEPEPVASPVPPKKCSEFAFPGFDMSGRQIGWVKPERGAYYFYPLSDKTCSNPTGRYDFNTGVISSLTDGSKIGTDSDHIGYRNVRQRDLQLPDLGLHDEESFANVAVAKNGTFSNANWGNTTRFQKKADSTATRKHTRRGAQEPDTKTLLGSAQIGEYVVSSRPYDRTFILRQFKPIPATIVSEVRADPSVYGYNKAGEKKEGLPNHSIPVRATVDRNVYSDDGRTVILPTGTLLMGYLDGELPGPYQTFGRMNIKWYQFIRPDGVEFNFLNEGQDPYSADAQGRMGVPGHGSTDYVEQMVMPILTALVPAAVNMIAPITDTVINQIDLDNNTIVQSGTIRSSEMAKQDIINTWNKITQKLLVDAIDNTTPPFSIAAGTRINVFSPVDLIVTCGGEKGEEDKDANWDKDGPKLDGKKCAIIAYGDNPRRKWEELKAKAEFVNSNDPSWVGQIRSFNLETYCEYNPATKRVYLKEGSDWAKSGYDYRTILAYCESLNYQAINNAKQTAYNQSVQAQANKKQDEYGITSYSVTNKGLQPTFSDDEKERAYNEEVLGLKYDDEGNIINPFSNQQKIEEELLCEDGGKIDMYGCCPGETYTDMGDSYIDENGSHFACCPDIGGDCFPPVQ